MDVTDTQNKYLDKLQALGKNPRHISGQTQIDHNQSFAGNIENFIGFAQIPIGLAGPLLLNGTAGSTEHLIPMATTEGALVASYNRGIKAGSMSGGFVTRTIANQVQRSPYFEFDKLTEAMAFGSWIKSLQTTLEAGVRQVSRFAKLSGLEVLHEGNGVHVTFSFETGAAAGQNMVTIVTDHILKQVLAKAPHTPKHFFIDANMSGDKKSNYRALSNVRGRKVISEVLLTKEVIQNTLKSSAENIAKLWQTGTLAALQAGAVGNQGHIANALTAIFIACGQDVACIAEAAVGISRVEAKSNGDLYASLTLPGLIVGPVGGGTALPTQKEALEIMDCNKPEDVNKFAEICCAVALAGELSIGAAIAEGHFASAHQALGRKR
ncbi:MAG: hydroxymethylglutaryl-CoA reductase [Saprospiraceae bacterium]